MPTKSRPRRRSELWQRLRAARAHVQLTQRQMAEAIVATGTHTTRSALALWESTKAANRTTPDAQQLAAFAKVAGVPVEFLLDDNYSAEDLQSLLVERGEQRRVLAESEAAPHVKAMEAKAKAFWSAVKFHVIDKRPEYLHSFDVPVNAAGLPVIAHFLHGDRVCAFVSERPDWADVLLAEASRMLLIERACGRDLRKFVLVYSNTAGTNGKVEEFDVKLGIKVESFADINRATTRMLAI